MNRIFVKNMVCNRCIMVVKTELEKLGFTIKNISLGEIEIENSLTEVEKSKIEHVLAPLGFELINDKKSRIISQIKSIIIEFVHGENNDLKVNISELLISRLNHDYSYISTVFSEIEGKTIEKYVIEQKVEKVKELLVYDELSLSEIAYQLNYSSVAYLSNQFKKITGFTPSYFKNIKEKKRKSLDEL